jgi:hypothetical protein
LKDRVRDEAVRSPEELEQEFWWVQIDLVSAPRPPARLSFPAAVPRCAC